MWRYYHYSVQTPWNQSNDMLVETVLLVARTIKGGGRIHLRMCRMPMTQGQQPTYSSSAKPHLPHTRGTSVRHNSIWFHHEASRVTRFWLHPHHHRPWLHKMSHFITCREEINAEDTAALYTKQIFPSHGLPSKIISDRDPHFASRFTRELCNILDIKQNISTAYHPCTDGQSEWTNQWLEQYLCFWTNEHQDNWATYLPMVEFTHNNWPNETTHESPFFLLMGYNPHADRTDCPSPIPQVALRLDQFKQAQKHAEELMIKAQKSWVKHKDMPKYKVRDQVWLEGCHLRTNQPTTKLVPRRHGPFKIVQVMSPVNYCLELPMLISTEGT